MPRIAKPKPPKINKRTLVERLVEKPTSNVLEWLKKEYCILSKIENQYPLQFLDTIKFSKKLPSLAVLYSDWGKKELAAKFHAFNYQTQEHEKLELLPEKVGNDIQVSKKISLRELI